MENVLSSQRLTYVAALTSVASICLPGRAWAGKVNHRLANGLGESPLRSPAWDKAACLLTHGRPITDCMQRDCSFS